MWSTGMNTVGRWNYAFVLHVCHTRQGQPTATTAQCLYNDLSLFMKIKAILLTFSLDFLWECVFYILS